MGATIGDAQGVVSISNDDSPLPTVSVADLIIVEGNAGTTNAVVTITLSAASTSAVSVTWATANGTATAGSDYVSSTNTATFAPGETTQMILIAINGDGTFEPDEAFLVNLSNPSGATINDGNATVTIANDDAPAVLPTLSINSPTVTEGNNGGAAVTVMLTVTRSSSTGVSTVNWSTVAVPNSAVAGGDYTAASGTLTFNNGDTVKTIVITIAGDKKAEPTETFTVVLGTTTNASVATGTGVVTIFDNDGALLATTAGPSSSAQPLTAVDAVDLLAIVVRGWLDAGATADRLDGLTILIADLPGTKLADTLGRTITLDVDAAGWGWALTPAALTADRIDLASVLAHELGHVLGLEHGGGVMTELLAPGQSLPAPSSVSLGGFRVASPALTSKVALHDPAPMWRLVAPSRLRLAATATVAHPAHVVVPVVSELLIRPSSSISESVTRAISNSAHSQQDEPLTVVLLGLALAALLGRRRHTFLSPTR